MDRAKVHLAVLDAQTNVVQGKIDLRPIGAALFGKWDQDLIAETLSMAREHHLLEMSQRALLARVKYLEQKSRNRLRQIRELTGQVDTLDIARSYRGVR